MLRLRLAPAVPAILLLACGGGLDRPDFTFLEAPPVSEGASHTHLTHAPDGQPWIAYSDFGTAQTRVAQWTGSRWEERGQPAPINSGVEHTRAGQLAFGAGGQPFLGERVPATGGVLIRTWDGAQWNDVATFNGYGPGDVMSWDLRIDPAGQPIISTLDSRDVDVRTWTDGAWELLGFGELARNIPNPSDWRATLRGPSMELDPQGHPVVAHLEGDFTLMRLWVQRWTGTQWQLLGGPVISESEVLLTAPDLALDPQGTPYVMWTDIETSSRPQRGRVYVRRWTGQDWEPLGGPITLRNAGTPVEAPALRIDTQGRPVLSFVQGSSFADMRIHLRRWNGTSWEVLGNPLNGAEQDPLFGHAMAIGPDGAPLLAWSQRIGESIFAPGRQVLYVARYNERH